ncbi:MAG: hypothetical protein GY765_36215 [bacterium]|nr:hypothetical protein [bacterium]
MKGELKCTKHRNFLSQLGMIRLQHGIDEEGLRALFKLPGYNPAAAPAAVANAGKKAAAAAPAASAAGNAAAGAPAGKTEPAPGASAVTESVPSPTTNAESKAPVSGIKAEANAPVGSPKAPSIAIPMSPKQHSPPGVINKPTSPLLTGAAASGTNWSLSMDGNSSLNSILSCKKLY